MATRQLRNYFGINTKSAHANNRFATDSINKNVLPLPKKATLKHELKDFFSNRIFAWFIHDWRVKRPYNYPDQIGEENVYELKVDRLTVALAADWGSDTPEAQFIGKKIGEKNTDFTVHLGDIYYSGAAPELENNYGAGNNDFGIWPRGSKGSFALAGNHEMFSGGTDYFTMIQNPVRGFGILDSNQNFSGQPAPVFCMKTANWCILGLDTGYQSLKSGIFRTHPDNQDLMLEKKVIDWLTDVVKIKEETRGIVVLTHHQYISAFNGEDEFAGPAVQLEQLLPNRKIIWIWGHEHRFSMYGLYKKSVKHISAFGRCIGNGGMPDEHSKDRYVLDKKATDYNLVLYDKRVANTVTLDEGDAEDNVPEWKEDVGYNGYAVLEIEKEMLSICYYASYGPVRSAGDARDEKVVEEKWTVAASGEITCIDVVDNTKGRSKEDSLSYSGDDDPGRAGK